MLLTLQSATSSLGSSILTQRLKLTLFHYIGAMPPEVSEMLTEESLRDFVSMPIADTEPIRLAPRPVEHSATQDRVPQDTGDSSSVISEILKKRHQHRPDKPRRPLYLGNPTASQRQYQKDHGMTDQEAHEMF